jgi:hypothetical protein
LQDGYQLVIYRTVAEALRITISHEF